MRWKSRTVSALGSSLCPSAHMSGVWIHMAATSLTTQRWASDLVINPLTSFVFLHLRTTNLPGPDSIIRSEHAQQRENKNASDASITNMTVREEDVHDRDPVHQSHVSASIF